METEKKPRYLTKSRFKLALKCPTMLYYDGKPEYANQQLEDSFLKALADGGFQVGELAKYYFPGGHSVETLDSNEVLAETNELLKKDNVVIFEAAVRYKDFFIRADILQKEGNHLDLLEVKAKSFTPVKDRFFNKNGTLSSKFYEYLADAAFQKYVISQAFPGCTVAANLMLIDKTAICPTDGLNQKFKITRSRDDRTHVTVMPEPTQEDLSIRLLTTINVDDCCDVIYHSDFGQPDRPMSFTEYIDFLGQHYKRNEKIPPVPSS